MRTKAKPAVISGVDEMYRSIFELGQHLEKHPGDLTILANDGSVKQLQAQLVQSSSRTYHLILYDPEMISNFDEHTVQMDGTFNAVPRVKGVTQLLTLMAKKYNVVNYMFNNNFRSFNFACRNEILYFPKFFFI